MTAETVNVVFDQGTTVSMEFNITNSDGTPYDLTGSLARAQMRKHHESNTSTSFTCSIINSTVILALTAAQSANVQAGRYVYDIEIVNSSNNVTRVIEGMITVKPEVTR